MNKADAIPSMRAAEIKSLRAVEEAISGPVHDYVPESYRPANETHFSDAGLLEQARYYTHEQVQELLQDHQGEIDPVIRGLLTHLPPSGSVWPIEARKQWLELMEGSFKLIFKDKPAEPAS